MQPGRIYLDNAATTPVDPAVETAMHPFVRDTFHNPSALYEGARQARAAIDRARDTLAQAIGCSSDEIVFTSSGTEAANLAIVGIALAERGGRRNRILLSAAEHHCVVNTKPLLESIGFRVQSIPVEADASVTPEAVERMLGDDVLIVSAMHANNETGAITDAASIGVLCKSVGSLYFCDAVQTFGLLPINVQSMQCDMLALSAHKIYGPKGAGALYIRSGVKPNPIMLGGSQEMERRAGTENVPSIVGMAKAVELAQDDQHRSQRIRESRDAFVRTVQREFIENGLPTPVFTPQVSPLGVLPGHAHFRIPGVQAETLLVNLDRLGVDASSGSACSSGSIEPSHVLSAIGWPQAEAKEALRLTFGKDTTVEESVEAARRLTKAAAQVLSARYART